MTANCSLTPCRRDYTADVINGVFTETLVNTATMTWGPVEWGKNHGLGTYQSIRYPCRPLDTGKTYSLSNITSLAFSPPLHPKEDICVAARGLTYEVRGLPEANRSAAALDGREMCQIDLSGVVRMIYDVTELDPLTDSAANLIPHPGDPNNTILVPPDCEYGVSFETWEMG